MVHKPACAVLSADTSHNQPDESRRWQSVYHGWRKAKAIDEQDIARFLELARNNGFGTLLAHAPYTLNPCSADPGVARFAAQVLKEDLELMEHLPGNLYNFHPGCHVGQGAEKGIELVAGQLNDDLRSW